MFDWDFEVDAWVRFWRWNLIKICVWELVIWTQPSGPLCLWLCLNISDFNGEIKRKRFKIIFIGLVLWYQGEIWTRSGHCAVHICRTICHTYCPSDGADMAPLNITEKITGRFRYFDILSFSERQSEEICHWGPLSTAYLRSVLAIFQRKSFSIFPSYVSFD